MFPIGPRRRRWLNQSTHFRVFHSLLGGYALADAAVRLGLRNPPAQGPPTAPDLGRNGPDRSRSIRVASEVVEYHPTRALAGLRRAAVRSVVSLHSLRPYSLRSLRRSPERFTGRQCCLWDPADRWSPKAPVSCPAVDTPEAVVPPMERETTTTARRRSPPKTARVTTCVPMQRQA